MYRRKKQCFNALDSCLRVAYELHLNLHRGCSFHRGGSFAGRVMHSHCIRILPMILLYWFANCDICHDCDKRVADIQGQGNRQPPSSRTVDG